MSTSTSEDTHTSCQRFGMPDDVASWHPKTFEICRKRKGASSSRLDEISCDHSPQQEESGRKPAACALGARRRARDPSDGPVQPAGSPRSATRTLAGIGRAIRALDGRGGGWQQAVATNASTRQAYSGPPREPSTSDRPFVGSMMSPTANGAWSAVDRSPATFAHPATRCCSPNGHHCSAAVLAPPATPGLGTSLQSVGPPSSRSPSPARRSQGPP